MPLESKDRSHGDTFPAGTGLLLVGHGSRDTSGVDEFLAAATVIAELAAGTPVEPCFLEFAEPSIPAGFRALADRGVRRVVVVPVLLFAAGHAKRDIPAAVAAAAGAYPQIEVEQCGHLGCHEALVQLSQQRYEEAIAGRQPLVAGSTALILVGRGSRDPEATAEMRQFAALRSCEALQARTAYVAMAEPALEAMLNKVAASDVARGVVQPHLLFGGVLVDRIGETVARFAKAHSHIEWITAGHLGPEPLVAAAALARARETLSGPHEPRGGATATGDRFPAKH